MNIRLNPSSTTPLYLQIKNQIQNLILSGELPERFKLPSERSLASRLSVHRNTVVKAYEALIAEGLVTSSHRKPCGYFVGSSSSISEDAPIARHGISFSSLDKI